MTKKINQRLAPPLAWEGAGDDPAFWRGVGADAIARGVQLSMDGIHLPPLWRWFDRSQPVWAESVARMFCHCGSGPVAHVKRVWQDGRDSIALISYQQRRRVGNGSEMLEFRAALHPASEYCEHGQLVMHTDESLETHCRSHDLSLTGAIVARSIGAAGGWSGSTDAESPAPRRVVLH